MKKCGLLFNMDLASQDACPIHIPVGVKDWMDRGSTNVARVNSLYATAQGTHGGHLPDRVLSAHKAMHAATQGLTHAQQGQVALACQEYFQAGKECAPESRNLPFTGPHVRKM